MAGKDAINSPVARRLRLGNFLRPPSPGGTGRLCPELSKSKGEGLGRHLIDHAVDEAGHFHLPAIRLYTNVAMTENLSMYAHLGFVETHRAIEKGFHRVYLRLTLPEANQ